MSHVSNKYYLPRLGLKTKKDLKEGNQEYRFLKPEKKKRSEIIGFFNKEDKFS